MSIVKKPAPKNFSSEIDYRIVGMQHWGTFQVAEIYVVETAENVIVHNRYGAWFIGDPAAERGSPMKDLLHEVAASLQEYKARWLKDQAAALAGNPFFELLGSSQ